MGVYLNPGNAGFAEALRSKIYVDKTGLIAYTNEVLGTKQKNVCVSRPRRFGKSMAAEMLAAYYSRNCDSREMFAGLEIAEDESFESYLNQCDVIFVNVQNFLSRAGSAEKMIDCLQEAVLEELRKAFAGKIDAKETHLATVLEKLYSEEQAGFVFILDEWDCIFREKKNDIDVQTMYLDFLRNLLKDRMYVKLAYMTGILPIKKYGTHSALNMFDEFSMMNPGFLTRFVGFTESEVCGLCEQFEMDFAEARAWYDGYKFRKEDHIYSPKSVVDAMRNQLFDSYWTQTETYDALKIYIAMNFDGLKDAIVQMLGGNSVRINPRTFQNDMLTFKQKDDVLTLLVHLGYLGYDAEKSVVYIPNREVEMEFTNAVEGAGWDEVIHTIEDSENLLEAVLSGDADAVAAGVTEVHMDSTSILQYNNENALSCVISLAFYSARNYYNLIRELPSGKGFADIVFIPRMNHQEMPAIIVELKWDETAHGAIEQIKERKYVKSLKDYQDDILLVGISYDKESKVHQCLIEKYKAE